MRTIFILIRKEFIQIVRNKSMLPVMIVVPVVQMFVLVYAANLNMKNIDFVILDLDQSPTSLKLANKFASSPFFIEKGRVYSIVEADKLLRNDRADLVIQLPSGMEKNLTLGQGASVQFLINGINSMAAVLTGAYAQNILMDFNRELLPQYHRISSNSLQNTIEVTYSHWYNPELDFKIFMVPGILVILVSLVGWMLTALNIVREKELGTIEQINVSPIRKYQFILGKLIPFWVIGLFELGFGLFLGRLVFHVPIVGSLLLLFLFAAVYLVSVLAIGLFISAVSETQQQVMFISFFFALTFILMSGIFTPVESMPDWAHWVNLLNPLAYFMKVIRMILLKGAGFCEVWKEFLSVAVYGSLMTLLAVRSYRKRA